jgi:hypothetical protein
MKRLLLSTALALMSCTATAKADDNVQQLYSTVGGPPAFSSDTSETALAPRITR